MNMDTSTKVNTTAFADGILQARTGSNSKRPVKTS